ncbi:SCO family protein [Paraconexibacter antarcticus]|uniref:SCO family protein n=1 Tax=Paraconexibacter antarcticus TaxID=2949664 RepID=A0ABY5E157_9ACTN|nr:SCO family protein [Paraconexibacter antarcticus]UTI66944.1 SCO family protein [Paraconexibacter antarcticus]
MLARVQLTLAAVLGLVALVLAGVYVLGPDGGVKTGSTARLAVGPFGYVGAVAPPGLKVRDFTLADEDGHTRSLAAERGKVVVLTFMYSTCQDTCPATASAIRLGLDELGRAAADVPVLAVSVDPAGDTELNTKRFLLKQSLLGRMHFLRGTRAQLAPVWKEYFVHSQGPGTKQQDEHTIEVLILGRDGRQVVSFPVDAITPEALAHDLRKVIAARHPA